MDIQAMEENLLRISETWNAYNSEFEDSDEFKFFMKRLPMNYFLNTSTIMHLWTMDSNFQRRYEQLENTMKQLFLKAQKIVHKLFSLSKRCHKQPLISLPRQRSSTYWLNRIQSILYCNENVLLGSFSEETHSCTCPNDQVACHGFLPCIVGDGAACLTCAPDNRTRCGSCNTGYMLSQGLCKPEVADSTEHYIGFETDLQDLEMKYLLQKTDRRIEVHAIFISNDMRLNSWFDPSWRKRMLLTLKSNKYKSSLVHMILGLSLQICLTKNSTLEPVLAVYVNPFGGSHSESWFMPVNENSFPDWERTKLDLPLQCYNWTLTLGNKWKTFFETVHIYLRSRIKSNGPNGNESIYYEPLEFIDPSRNLGYMKINNIQVFGYSMHFDPEAIRDLILQLDYPYTQGSQDSALLQLLEIRDRVNKLSPPGQRRLDLFSCLLRHRLKLSTSEVVRIQSALQAFNAKLPNTVDYDTTKLCS
uniref:BMP/retinoic acid inducible neural specific 3 n=1 Tax=Sphenodon punctatus TaxID=8508 RepID=A0A8D0HCA5_SPHPU